MFENYYVYSYQYIDSLCFMVSPEKYLGVYYCQGYLGGKEMEEFRKVEEISKLFIKHGWEGDGDIEVFWLPSFVFGEECEDTELYGVVVWHVKQDNNGISYLASSVELPFSGLVKELPHKEVLSG